MEHPISELMQTAMSSMKDMVDVNTVVGHPVQASSGSTIIPISRVTFGYMTAGGDLPTSLRKTRRISPSRAAAARAYPCSRLGFSSSLATPCGCSPRPVQASPTASST
jgi:uncharacterized spore protein YtfJ